MPDVKVLIIDDEPGLCWALEKALCEDGYEVFKADSGYKGLETMINHNLSLVLLDYKMTGMDGLEVLDKIREIQPDLPVIFMTGHSSISTAVTAIKGGAVAYVTKPFHISELKATVKDVLGQV